MNSPLDRREFLQKGTAGTLTAVAAATAPAVTRAEDESTKPVRIGVVGVGSRGRWHITNMLNYQDNVVIPAISADY